MIPSYFIDFLTEKINSVDEYVIDILFRGLIEIYENDKESYNHIIDKISPDAIDTLLVYSIVDGRLNEWQYEYDWSRILLDDNQRYRLIIKICCYNEVDKKFINKSIEHGLINLGDFIDYANMRSDKNINDGVKYLYKQLKMPDTNNKGLTEYRDKMWNRKKSVN